MNIYEYITQEKIAYETIPVPVVDNFEWHMYRHIQLCTLYKDGKLSTGNTDDKPVKNIILPILNVHYRTEGFDVKNIQPFVNDEKDYYKSFLIKHFHEKWARKNNIDTFIDDMVESYVDYGGALIRNENEARPSVIPLQTIAFCDQTDLLSGTFAILHMYSVDQLLEMSDKWDKDMIDLAIHASKEEKEVAQNKGQKKAKTPSKYIEVYEIHGVMPKEWLVSDDDDYADDEKEYIRQVQIIVLNQNDKDNKSGYCLYKGKEKDGIFKLLKRDKRFGTALGRSAIEELFEPQVWTNYSMIQMKKMLDTAALILLQTSDPAYVNKNKISDLRKAEILTHSEGNPLTQITIQPQNMEQFEASVTAWENHARTTGSANDAMLGINPSSGTPFKLQDLVVQQGTGMHDFRRGKIAEFMGEIYCDWVLKYLVNEMNDGQKFIAEFSLEELNAVADNIITNHVNDIIKHRVLNGGMITPEEQQALTEKTKAQFMKGGNKRFIELMKNEFKNIPIDVEMNIAGKQKDLNLITDKLTNIFRQIISNPQALQDPNAAKIFNQILESSGLSPINFITVKPPLTVEANPSPIQPATLTNNQTTNG